MKYYCEHSFNVKKTKNKNKKLAFDNFVDVPLIFFCPADHVLPDWQHVAFRRKALFVNGVSEFVKVAGM